MSNVIELRSDPLETISRAMDRVVLDGAAHVTLIVTYPNGQQVMLKSTNQEADSFLDASGFQ